MARNTPGIHTENAMNDAQKATAARAWLYCKDAAKNIWIKNEPDAEYQHSAACLLFGTAAHESNEFDARRQYGFSKDSESGAFSLWQMERTAVENSLIAIKKNKSLEDRVAAMTKWDGLVTTPFVLKAIQQPEGDLFACILARLYYLRCPGNIPNTIYGQSAYWKRWWNTYLGAGTEHQYLSHWERCCKPIVEADQP